MITLRIVNRDSDHVIVTTDGPARFEVSLFRPGDRDVALILHGYTGSTVDPEQDPSVTYDGTERDDMADMTSLMRVTA